MGTNWVSGYIAFNDLRFKRSRPASSGIFIFGFHRGISFSLTRILKQVSALTHNF